MLRCSLAVLFLVTTGFAQSTSRMDKAVQSYVSHNKFMGSVLVARGDQVVFSKSYGYADLERKIPNAPATRFRIGSITKQFTAAAILLLEERGELHIRNPIQKYLPDMPAGWSKVTISHLLTHTAGIPAIEIGLDVPTFVRFPHTPEQLVAVFRDKPLEFWPGQRMRYSNAGYVLLGYLIEKVSGKSYPDFLKTNIFMPLGMKDSGYDSDSVPHHALGYAPGRRGPARAAYWDMSNPYSAGALYSTTGDLLRWEQALFGGKLLSAASLAKMTKPYLNGYGLGLEIKKVNGRKQISHTGEIPGFDADLAYFPDTKVAVAVLANLNGDAPFEIGALLTSLAHGDKVVTPPELRWITLSAGLLVSITALLAFVRPPKNRPGRVTQSSIPGPDDRAEPVIAIDDLHFSYSSLEVLHGISFRVHRGEMVGLLGPNGAGKSTTLKILTGIHPADAGKVHIAGFRLPEQHLEIKRIIGYLPESPLIYECLSGTEFLELVGRLQGLEETTLRTRIRALMEAFELSNIRVPRLSGYSKGMRQKILLSAALLHNPEVLLLDEPLSGLDVDTSILIKDLLMTLCAQGKTILYSSHVLDVVEKVCHRVIVIDHGSILADAPLEELKARTGEESLELIFRKLTHSEDTSPKIAQVMEALQS